MGLFHSGLRSEQLADLRKLTPFETKELKQEHKEFLRRHPSGRLTRVQFSGIFRRYFPGSDPEQFSARVFDVFDKNGDGKIDFKEFMCALTVTHRETSREKLELAFRFYDVNSDGYIEYDEVLEMLRSVNKMTRQKLDSEKFADKIFKKKDKNGRLSYDEFIALDQDPIIQPIIDIVSTVKRASL